MIIVSNTTAQTLAVGQSITFDNVILHTGCGECFRHNTNSVKLKANGIYEITFSGNIAGAAATPIQISLALGGSILPETTMMATSSTIGTNRNVSTTTAVRNCCGDFDRITVVNSGENEVTIDPNSSLFIKRISG